MYQLAAFDMDGTLLTTDKYITEGTRSAIQRAVEAGKQVVLETGRSAAELKPYEKDLSDVRYGVLESGGLIYDFREQKVLNREIMQESAVSLIAEAVTAGPDMMVFAMTEGQCVIQRSQFENLRFYHMAQYAPLYEKVALQVEDILDYILHAGKQFEKINLYHRNPADRKKTLDFLKERGCSLDICLAEETSLELTPAGTNKGDGLLSLCRLLGIPAAETIAVGDGENDIPMLEKAGLAVAMGNAVPAVIKAADMLVKDCDHEGCVQVIDTCLLGSRVFRKMRRFNQQLSEEACMAILNSEKRGVLSLMGDDGYPYGIPLDYVYTENKIYFHGASEGKKMDSIRKNPKACFTVMNRGEKPEDDWAYYVQSVISFGEIRIVTHEEEKMDALWRLGRKYYPDDTSIQREVDRDGKRACMLCLEIHYMTGKTVHEK